DKAYGESTRKKVEIVTGFLCNNHCKFCSVGERRINRPLEEIKREIDRAVEEEPYEINLTGGEPTIRKDIFELISYARKKVNIVRITTNGRLLYYEWFAKKLVEAGLTGAIFSLHSSDAKTHDYLTSVKGSFGQLMKGMENLSKIVEDISVKTVVNTLNYKQLPAMVKKTIDRFKVKTYCLIYPTIDGIIVGHTELMPRYENVRPYVHRALEVVREKNRVGWVLNVPPCFLDKEEQNCGTMKLNTIMYWPDMRTDLDKKKLEGKIKIDKCKGCELRENCPGIPSDYYELHMAKKA
ncbi:MAG: radical SAM protein, partial [Candidatus Aenigmatarchaeota archaeon]